MNKRKGFTLIELLAVIVILAIIAFIATPIVMNVIEKSKKGAAERSAENHLSAIETAVMEKRVEGQTLLDGTYDLTEIETKLGTIEISGQKATAATIMIKDGQVLDGSTLEINGYVVNIVDRSGKVGEFGTVVDSVPNQTEAIKYDPVVNEPCENAGTGTCYNWYVLDGNETEYAHVSLIMDTNIDNTTVAWCNDETLCQINNEWNNSAGPITAMNYLKEQTSNWTVSAKLPTGEQIAKAGGDTVWTPSEYTGTVLSTWLYDYLDGTTNSVSGVNGYWTSTPEASTSDYAWYVSYDGSLYDITVDIDDNYGVRPVITVLKSNLSS